MSYKRVVEKKGKGRFEKSKLFMYVGIVVLLILFLLGVGYYIDSTFNNGKILNSITGLAIYSLSPNLVGYWAFDDGSGTVAGDSSGNGNNGVLFNGPAWTTGISDGALSFDGVNDYVDTVNVDFATGSFTLSAWTKTTSATVQRILSKYSSPSDQKWLAFLPNGEIEAGIAGGSAVASGTAYNDGVWHLVTMSVNSSNLILYVDGIQKGIVGHGNSFFTNTNPWRIGAINSGGEYFNGLIDDVRIYNRSLSASEINNLYVAGSGTSPPVDVSPPTTPTSLTASALSSSQISLSWTASTDDIGVAGYNIYRDGGQVGFSSTTTYLDTGLIASTSYTYTVSAYDAAGNESVQSSSVVGTTQAISLGNVIVLDSSKTYQTINGWEVVAWISQFDDAYQIANVYKWRDAVADIAVNEFGINRVRLELQSGTENPVDYFTQYINGQIARAAWKPHWYEIINDNNDPFVINPNGFQFSRLDNAISNIVLPLKSRVEANGEKLYVNLNYVDFKSSSFEHYNNPDEYAELILATFQYMQSKYGWVPDAVEVVLEPDNSAGWSAIQVGNAMVATAKRLEINGYTPDFIIPGTMSMSQASSYFDQIIQIPEALKYIKEISYHRYAGVSTANLQKIANRAVQYGLRTSMLEWWSGKNGHNTLHEDLKTGRNSAWQVGGIATIGSVSNSLVLSRINISDPSNPKAVINSGPRYVRQYFKFIRNGAVRIDAVTNNNNFDPLGFINTNGKYVVVVKASIGGDFSIQNLPVGTYGIKYSTSSQYDIDLTDQVIISGGVLTTNIPASGVITIYAKTVQSDTTPPTTTVSPAGGTYTSIQNVILSINEAGTTYYTTNGLIPTTSSSIYSSPIPISQTTVLRFFSVDTSNNIESVNTNVYTINIQDTTPPVLSLGLPSGTLSSGTKGEILYVLTNENSTCKYSTTTGTSYLAMANTFSSTGRVVHTNIITGLKDGTSYVYYVRCQDTAKNPTTSDYPISFSVNYTTSGTGLAFLLNLSHWNLSDTTNFSKYNITQLRKLSGVKFANKNGRIKFLENLNLNQSRDLTSKIKIGKNRIQVNSSSVPEFNKSAFLTFKNVTLTLPIVKRDGVDCPNLICQNISYNLVTKTFTFDVTSFSEYTIEEQCFDGVQNYDETGIDCGGSCSACSSGGSGGGSSGGGGGGSSGGGETGSVESSSSLNKNTPISKDEIMEGSGVLGKNKTIEEETIERKAKGKLWLWIGIILIISAILVALVLFFFKKNNNREEIVQSSLPEIQEL